MPLDCVFRNYTRQRAHGPRFFTSVLEVASKHLHLGRRSVEVSITLVGPERMRAMNKRYRGINASTDVLSFPLQTMPARHGLVGPSTTRYTVITLGDIFICPALARLRALREGVSLRVTLAWLAIHGFLHLAGYDHERHARRRKTMFALEKKILKALRYGPVPHHLRN